MSKQTKKQTNRKTEKEKYKKIARSFEWKKKIKKK